jgi:hypothetical protein
MKRFLIIGCVVFSALAAPATVDVVLGALPNRHITGTGTNRVVSFAGQAVAYMTGGILTTNDGYEVCTFTNSGTLHIVGGTLAVSNLTVAGGGAGGTWCGGGGGAGGVVLTNLTLAAGDYVITVGAGGAKPTANGTGADGTNSTVASLVTALGGGGGGYSVGNSKMGSNGGSGGGGASGLELGNIQGLGGTNTIGQGSIGGNNYIGRSAGGGGGYSHSGFDGTNDVGGDGGDGGAGCTNIIGSVTNFYSGGGGGWQYNYTLTGSLGGIGGGGNGSGGDGGGGVLAGDGVANTGGGGGGGWYAPYNNFGGAGGSGIVKFWRKL